MTLRSLLTATILTLATALPSSAATFNIIGGFAGGPLGEVEFDFTVEGDFSGAFNLASDDILINSLTSTELSAAAMVPATVSGEYVTTDGGRLRLELAGFVGGVTATGVLSTLNFDVLVPGSGTAQNLTTDATISSTYTRVSFFAPFNGFIPHGSGSVTTTQITTNNPLTPVPLPAGGLLLLSGLGGIAAFTRRKKHAA